MKKILSLIVLMVLFINCASLVGATSNLNQNDKDNNNKHIALGTME